MFFELLYIVFLDMKEIFNSCKPYAVICATSNLGTDWFVVMFEENYVKAAGFRRCKFSDVLIERDMEPEDVKFLKANMQQFSRVVDTENLAVFEDKRYPFRDMFRMKTGKGSKLI